MAAGGHQARSWGEASPVQALPGANPLSWGACGINPSVHGITQEQLLLVPSLPRARKVKFTASLAQSKLFAGKSNGVGKGMKVEPKGWRPSRLSPSVEVAEKQTVRVHGASLTPGRLSPPLEIFLACFISGCLCFRLNYLGRVGCVGKSVP